MDSEFLSRFFAKEKEIIEEFSKQFRKQEDLRIVFNFPGGNFDERKYACDKMRKLIENYLRKEGISKHVSSQYKWYLRRCTLEI